MSLLLLMPLVPRAKAAWLTSLSDTMSSHVASALSNHSFSFVTRAGAAEGSTLVWTFASAFDTSSIDFTDIDLAVGGTDRSLAADCSGTEEISAAVASDILTLTVCAGDGGAIAADGTVTLEIGTNATSGATGDQQIRNPGTAGSYDITIHGSFGDRGNMAVAIEDVGGVTVSGTVSSGGTQPPPPPPPSTPPTISNITVTDITETSATVTWTTNEDADSKVDYGQTVSYEIGTETEASLITSHSVDLTNLSAGTTYHYRVRSANFSGIEAISADFTFTTSEAPDTDPPVISDVQVLNITSESATVAWVTDEAASSAVDYGLTDAYELGTIESATLVLDHQVALSGLTALTTYHYRVRSSDAGALEAISTDFTFTTAAPPDTDPPIISNISVEDITETSARITWQTDEDATSEVSYGISTEYEAGTLTELVFVTNHSMELLGLVPATTYHFQVRSVDAVLNSAASEDQTFATLPDTTPPLNVSDFVAVEISPGTAQLTWTNPPDPDFAGVRIVRRTDSFPTNPDDGTIIFDAPGTETTDPGLSPGTTYRYGAFAYDTSGNFATGALTQLTTATVCGDNVCMVGETTESCPGDCPPEEEPPEAVCGNTVCEAGETPQSCPEDCEIEIILPVCGNMLCEARETAESCPEDCAEPPEGSVCGNAVCEEDETADSCPADCAPPTPLPVVPGAELIVQVANRTITLERIDSTYEVLPGRPLNISVPLTSIVGDPEAILLQLGESIYMLALGETAYTTDVLSPSVLGEVPLILILQYPDQEQTELEFRVRILALGEVVTDIEGVETSLTRVIVTLLDQNDNPWPAGQFGQRNPVQTDQAGGFGWYAPNDRYTLMSQLPEYRTDQRTVRVSNNIVNPGVRLLALPPPLIEELQDIIAADLTIGETAGALTELIGQEAEYAVGVAREEFFDNPEVEEGTKKIAAPAIAVATVASAGAAASTAIGFVNLLNAARLFFTQPFLFFARRKRKAWGVVYNAVTKVPIGLAVVRLLDPKTGRVLQSRVTDKGGRYFFIVQPGEYQLEVRKQEFAFPTTYLKDKKTDALFLDLYHGETINVTETDATIAANVPIDPAKPDAPSVEVVAKIARRRVYQVISFVSPILALVSVIITPTPFTISLFGGQIILFGAMAVTAKPKKPKGWGIVYDEKTRKPLLRTIVRVFEPIYNKLLDTQVTDAKGRYSVLVGPNIYRVTFDKEGYVQGKLDPVDYRGKEEPTLIKEDVAMAPEAEEPAKWEPEPL